MTNAEQETAKLVRVAVEAEANAAPEAADLWERTKRRIRRRRRARNVVYVATSISVVCVGLAVVTQLPSRSPAEVVLRAPSKTASPATVESVEPSPGATTEHASSQGAEGPYDPNAEMRPDLMKVDPAAAAAGQPVELHFPEGTGRGVAHVLEERVTGGWQVRYYLTATDGHGGEQPGWAPAGAQWVWPDIGMRGPGPEVIRVPDTAKPGQYRICTGNAIDNFCSPLEVVAE